MVTFDGRGVTVTSNRAESGAGSTSTTASSRSNSSPESPARSESRISATCRQSCRALWFDFDPILLAEEDARVRAVVGVDLGAERAQTLARWLANGHRWLSRGVGENREGISVVEEPGPVGPVDSGDRARPGTQARQGNQTQVRAHRRPPSEGWDVGRSIRHDQSWNRFADRSNVQPDRPHQGQGVALVDHSGPHLVVEGQLAIVVEVVGEVDVFGPRGEAAGDLGQGQVVGGEEADGPPVDQATDDRLGPLEPVVRVRPVEDLVDQEQQRGRSARPSRRVA